MFTLIGKILDSILPDSDEEEEDIENEEQGCDEYTAKLSKLPTFEKNQEIIAQQLVHGQVTHIFNGQGLINHEIYFSFDSVIGYHNKDSILKVADLVSVTAIKKQEHSGWLAERVIVDESQWRSTGDNAPVTNENTQTSLIGKVDSIHDEKGYINEKIAFDIEDGCVNGFKPMVGDWVKADVIVASNNQAAENIEPLRSLTVDGEITLIKEDHGYISGNIFFTVDACSNSYKPKKWDKVKVTAIESEQGKCQWRATFLAPRTKGVWSGKVNRRQPTSSGEKWTIPGQRPKLQGNRMLPKRLEHYTVPDMLRASVVSNEEISYVSPVLTEELCMDNYKERFTSLLHLEEIQNELDIMEFSLSRVCLRPIGEYLALTVPGLAEGRPSILTGDKIILSVPDAPEAPRMEGFVHESLNREVLLKFNYEFHTKYSGEDYDVEFTFNRTSLRRCHQAIKLAEKQLGRDLLFPDRYAMKPPQVEIEKQVSNMDIVHLQTTYMNSPSLPNTKTENSKPSLKTKYADIDKVKDVLQLCEKTDKTNLGGTTHNLLDSSSKLNNACRNDSKGFVNPNLNCYQKQAVMKIVQGQSRPLPYIIFGPPGTGKTVTLVEAILQIFLRIPSSRIVACAPSNSAADLLVERLFCSEKIKVCDMVRLNSFNRKEDSIPEVVLPFSETIADNLDTTCRYRIVVCTCNTAGHLYNLGLPIGHFTHAFIDEAGQATEPECMIPLGLVSGADGQIILAGDPKQLGPVLMSPYAKLYGLDTSFLERIMHRASYSYNEEYAGFDSNLVTMLTENYRSHSAILEIPSKLFYYNQLQVKADPNLTHTLVDWSELPQKGFPLIFHGVRGEDLREGNSPSWFNATEAVLAVQYLKNLIEDPNLKLRNEDVGIITPYRKQVEKIRLLMEKLGIKNTKVGSVEEFQGQERQVIIISTVRSNERLVGFDVSHVLGFISNPKRFNVAITRAQAAFVVIGNPHILVQDENWRLLLQYCVQNGGYIGCDLPDEVKPKDTSTEKQE